MRDFEALKAIILDLSARVDASEFDQVMVDLDALDVEVAKAEVDDMQRAFLRFMLSSVMIDAADDPHSRSGLATGTAWAACVADDEALPWELRQNARQNRANGLLATYQAAERTNTDGTFSESANVEFRFGNIEDLRAIRVLYASVGNDTAVARKLRSRALCNLANTLDDSGRWVEAYAAYTDAPDADPTNGNAVGNLAELLFRRLAAGTGHPGTSPTSTTTTCAWPRNSTNAPSRSPGPRRRSAGKT